MKALGLKQNYYHMTWFDGEYMMVFTSIQSIYEIRRKILDTRQIGIRPNVQPTCQEQDISTIWYQLKYFLPKQFLPFLALNSLLTKILCLIMNVRETHHAASGNDLSLLKQWLSFSSKLLLRSTNMMLIDNMHAIML